MVIFIARSILDSFQEIDGLAVSVTSAVVWFSGGRGIYRSWPKPDTSVFLPPTSAVASKYRVLVVFVHVVQEIVAGFLGYFD